MNIIIFITYKKIKIINYKLIMKILIISILDIGIFYS